MVSMRLEKPICAPTPPLEVSPTLPSKQLILLQNTAEPYTKKNEAPQQYKVKQEQMNPKNESAETSKRPEHT